MIRTLFFALLLQLGTGMTVEEALLLQLGTGLTVEEATLRGADSSIQVGASRERTIDRLFHKTTGLFARLGIEDRPRQCAAVIDTPGLLGLVASESWGTTVERLFGLFELM